jgi:hypothetical protein
MTRPVLVATVATKNTSTMMPFTDWGLATRAIHGGEIPGSRCLGCGTVRPRLRYRRAHFALVVSIDILTREAPQRATRCGASTYLKRATGWSCARYAGSLAFGSNPRPLAWEPAP